MDEPSEDAHVNEETKELGTETKATKTKTVTFDPPKKELLYDPESVPSATMASMSTSRITLRCIIYMLFKYTFILTNIIFFLLAIYLLMRKEIVPWTADNALVICGLFFGVILAATGVFGALKDESYIVLTYSIAILSIVLWVTVLNTRNVYEELGLFAYVIYSFSFSYIIHHKSPSSVSL